MKSLIDFNLLFDKSKQPYKFITKKSKGNTSNNSEKPKIVPVNADEKSLVSAIDDFKYNKNNPLDEYFMYNGSFTKPSCDENVTYIIDPNPKIAPLNQIIVIININIIK